MRCPVHRSISSHTHSHTHTHTHTHTCAKLAIRYEYLFLCFRSWRRSQMQQRHRIFLQVQLQVIIVGVVVKDVAGDAAGFGFNSCVGQIGRSVGHGSAPLQRFCAAQAFSRGNGPRHSLHASA